VFQLTHSGLTKSFARSIACGILVIADAYPAELHGQLELGAFIGDTDSSWSNAGLGKARYENSTPTGRLALRGDAQLFSDFVAAVVLVGDSGADPILGIQEAWIGWNPVPQSPWRTRIKAGAFFPVANLEVGYESTDWTASRTLSSSAINSWIGEEIRVEGVELALLRRGAFVSSPHTVGITLGAFQGNDPAGTLLAWQGWNLGNRIAGLSENAGLPDLPVFRPDGEIPLQTRDVHVFREIDDRMGFYGGGNYAYSDRVEFTAMRYDNRGDPLKIERGQYSWHTRFDHLSLRLQLPQQWELLAQTIRGDTLMGPNAVRMDFSAWYLLGSHPLGRGLMTLRQDRFRTVDRDRVPDDANGECGHAWTVAYRLPLRESLNLISEAMWIESNRSARGLIGESARQIERSLNVAIRWSF
jgi:hypothetical protein